MFRRFSLNSNNSNNKTTQSTRQPPSGPPPARSQSHRQPASTSSTPVRSSGTGRQSMPNIGNLSLGGSVPTGAVATAASSGSSVGGGAPPPSYNAALRASVDGSTPLAVGAAPVGASAGAGVSTVPRANPRTGQGVQRRSSVEDRLAPLGRYDLVVLVDDSPSMLDHWGDTRDALFGVVRACMKYDRDGIDLMFMNNEGCKLENVTSPDVVAQAFNSIEPFGSTPTGVIMDELLRDYVERCEDAKTTKTRVKPLLLLVLTDGRADDPDMVKDIIIEFAQRLDEIRAPPYQLGLQFIQIGDDPDAAAFLQELDDDLKPQLGVRDMVDFTPYAGSITPEFILKAALGAVVKSIDG
ncbi:hypothetical protein JCM11641_001959 [Rhodosporidiobolus odoratus]